ncbi:TadE/TadG family type IV pilus assembly protein [Archangium sp.]|jgi:hypothetical protein|uniref:TadE/TadG family type IV pilus assembly protein n=1 Tax=Archangium sp. TaxID=1872627 RepID=UPI002ED9433A
MLRPRVQQQPSRRGAATVEFALVVPLLVSILMFSIFLSDILRAKLKLQEATRYVAWEMTSYTLSDYATGNHDKAFDVAMKASMDEATERFKDFDSIEPNAGPAAMMLRADPVQVNITNKTVAGVDLSRAFPAGSGGVGSGAASAVGKTLNYFLNHFAFNTKGQVEVEITSKLAAHMLPRRYLQKESKGFYSVDNWGGRDLSNLPVKNRYTLIANGWHLPDGGDAVVQGKRAGTHNGGSDHGLYLQVDRMNFLGVDQYLEQVGLDRLGDFADLVLPAFLGTFVVAKNYKPGTGGPDCNTPSHDAQSGLHNLDKKKLPGLDERDDDDDDLQRCFDTAPFRDTQDYSKSLYRQVFKARGENFMGCKNQMADMPNTPALDPKLNKDKNKNKITCE